MSHEADDRTDHEEEFEQNCSDKAGSFMRFFGKDECAAMYLAYKRHFRDPKVLDHIESCRFCHWFIFGTEPEEIQAAEIRDRRRRFMKVGAALILGSMTLGAAAFFSWQKWRTPPVSTILPGARANLDTIFAAGGPTAIVATLASSLPGLESNLTLEWIVNRQHVALYVHLVNSMGDPRNEVKRQAIAGCLQVQPLALKPHLAAMQLIHQAETDPIIRNKIKKVIDKVSRA